MSVSSLAVRRHRGWLRRRRDVRRLRRGQAHVYPVNGTARGRGIAKALLRRIEDESRAAGKLALLLETGTYQQEAIGLYQRMGFRPRGPFGPDAAMPARNIETSRFFEKMLGYLND
jgi:GNAT superfamily N-acetyltransferase